MICLVALSFALAPQRGDVKNEEQPPLRAEWRVPTPAPRAPEESLASFRVASGLKVELVACEPLVVAPVCAVFDEHGLLWVCEMRTYMRDADGTGEAEPSNAVVVLRDRDRDGRMDERRVFLDGLVLPRAVAPTRGGALVLAPPNLLFARDTDGDGAADDVRTVDTGLQGIASPEHAINGLWYATDGWFWCANAPWRYRWEGERLVRGRTAGGGQWGISQDRFGRIFYNDNSTPLRADAYPSQFAVRNSALGVAHGMGVSIARGSRPNPTHFTPGVNRGYRGTTLQDGKLSEFTGACGPLVYEGDALPERYRGAAFVCEVTANLVHHFELERLGGELPKATSASGGGVLIESDDERFRPVNLSEGPDGALYVVDMYRGVIQHRLFVTSWLRAQMEERALEEPIDRGRIWRITAADAAPREQVKLAECSWTELGNALSSPNRWTRQTAQRLFAEEGDTSRDAAEVLAQVVDRSDELARPHLASLAAEPADAAVLARLGEDLSLERLLALSTLRTREAFDAFVASAWSGKLDATRRGAIVSGLAGREFEFLRRTLERRAEGCFPVASGPDELALVELIGACAANDGGEAFLGELVDWIGGFAKGLEVSHAWRNALAKGALGARAKDAQGNFRPLRVPREPAALVHGLPEATAFMEALVWRGKPGSEGLFPRDLDAREQARFEQGRSIYEQTCAACHQVSGRGDIATAPPLRNSPWVLGDPRRTTKIVLHGLSGPVTLDDFTWDGEMPSHSFDDEDTSSVLTYIRRAWNHGADPVAPELVRAVREAHAARRGPWHVSELP
ncbi:MAG: c-type cytochrome [Planctomycetes bacterium]|nr:c-type cytochrome [Planctomycetota bacterium]